MKTKITNAKAADLLEILSRVSQQKKMPLKFCIARNIKILQEITKEYTEEKDLMFKEAVVMDDEGNAVIKEDFKELSEKMQGRVAYTMFEYSDEVVEKDFFDKLKKLNETEVEIEFVTERADRVIKISNEKGEYENSSIRDVLEDPNNEITPAMITLFLEYFLEM